jgi:hypothetical protein
MIDQGQISKLLARLEGLGLIANVGDGHVKGAANAWCLTERGEQVEHSLRGHRPPVTAFAYTAQYKGE